MKAFLLNLVCFAACIEGLFFFAAFAYVYYMRSRGLLQGLASGTSWVFRDESAHIEFAMEVIATVRLERPELFDDGFSRQVTEMIREAVDCELSFAEDTLSQGVSGLSIGGMRDYLQYVADRRLEALRIAPIFGSRNPFDFMELQDVQELTNFFERRVSAYQVGDHRAASRSRTNSERARASLKLLSQNAGVVLGSRWKSGTAPPL